MSSSSTTIEFEVKAFPMGHSSPKILHWVLKLRFPKLLEHDCWSSFFVQLHLDSNEESQDLSDFLECFQW
jgi:hypothetical protein